MIARSLAPAPPQDELPLASVLSHAVFPGRTVLYVHEVAEALACTIQHVIDLIDEGRLRAINIAGAGNKTNRSCWRVPVSAFDAFIRDSAQ